MSFNNQAAGYHMLILVVLVKRNDEVHIDAKVQQRLLTILEHWGSRGVYNEPFVNELKGLVANQQPGSSASFGTVSFCLPVLPCNQTLPSYLSIQGPSHRMTGGFW